MADAPVPFVSLKSLKHGVPNAADALADIRRIYFSTTRRTIEHDFAHAIELLKRLPDEDHRGKATVYMQGLAEMRREWQPKVRSQKSEVRSKSELKRKKSKAKTGNRRASEVEK